MARILSVFNDRKSNKQDQQDFIKFVDEHDSRRGTDFLKTFPEMQDVYTNFRTI
jgi:hypothetical protein